MSKPLSPHVAECSSSTSWERCRHMQLRTTVFNHRMKTKNIIFVYFLFICVCMQVGKLAAQECVGAGPSARLMCHLIIHMRVHAGLKARCTRECVGAGPSSRPGHALVNYWDNAHCNSAMLLCLYTRYSCALHRSVCVRCQVAKFFVKYTSLVGAGPQARPTMRHVAALPRQTCI